MYHKYIIREGGGRSKVWVSWFKLWHFGVVVAPAFLHGIRQSPGSRGMTVEKCYDWAKEKSRRMPRAKHPVVWLKPFWYDLTKIPVRTSCTARLYVLGLVVLIVFSGTLFLDSPRAFHRLSRFQKTIKQCLGSFLVSPTNRSHTDGVVVIKALFWGSSLANRPVIGKLVLARSWW